MPRPVALADLPDRMAEADLWDQVGGLEHEQLDFKLRPDGLDEVFAAMAMTDGGLIVLGIRDNRAIEGCPMTQRVLDRVTETAHACGLEVQVRELIVDGTGLTVVGVPEVRGRIITTPNGRLLRHLREWGDRRTGGRRWRPARAAPGVSDRCDPRSGLERTRTP